MQSEDALAGCLSGIAVGDALGLPLEGLPPQRARKLFGKIGDDFRMRLFFGRGLVSDDTEHAILTLQAAVAAGAANSPGDADKFQAELAGGLKFWFLALPPGTGLATAKACLKLLFGVSPGRAGVASAGNGPAMRAPVLGVLLFNEAQLRTFNRVSARLTHTDAKAEYGSLAIALAARCASAADETSPREFLSKLERIFQDDKDCAAKGELLALVNRVVESVESQQSTPDFAVASGLQKGVSGYIYHTVPICLHAWLSHQSDFQKAVLAVLRCGGDADSTAAITGGIVGAHVGKNGVPEKWRNAIAEWPRSMAWMEHLAHCAECGEQLKTPFWFGIATFGRNLFLLTVVLAHGFRRLLPPY